MSRGGGTAKPAGHKRRTKISGQFAWRTIEMISSPAFQVLSLAARRVLDRLEIELASHGGTENGRLIVTFNQLQTFGIDRDGIAPAIRELEWLGFVQVTERGRAGNAEHRAPNRFRIVYRPTDKAAPTDEWRRIETAEQAQEGARAARAARSRGGNGRSPKKIPSRGFPQVSVGENQPKSGGS